MSLDPSPMSPSPTPLLNPTDPVPGRGSALIGAVVSVALAVIIGIVATRFSTSVVFFAEGFNVKSQAISAAARPHVQGFSFYWTRSFGSDGYNAAQIPKILQNEAHDYHMNLAVITITANQITQNGQDILFQANDGNIDAYPDATYLSAAQAARAAGLVPAFQLDVRVIDKATHNFDSSTIGKIWWSSANNSSHAAEVHWFDSYTQFAVHYAQLAQQAHAPLLIIGHNLPFMTSPNQANAQGDDWKDGHAYTCKDRRECAWKHVISAARGATYLPSGATTPIPGGGFTGKITYAASIDPSLGLVKPEWQAIPWWDATDYIGVDAYFPLTAGADTSPEDLAAAWQGQKRSTDLAGQNVGDVIKAFDALSQQFNKSVLFTAAGYESISQANTSPPGNKDSPDAVIDQQEQLFDMQALLTTFTQQPWWAGVIWKEDYPVWPRSNLATVLKQTFGDNIPFFEPDWAVNWEWAGDCLKGDTTCTPDKQEKESGQWLRGYYKPEPLDLSAG
jgi:hypothetical protein